MSKNRSLFFKILIIVGIVVGVPVLVGLIVGAEVSTIFRFINFGVICAIAGIAFKIKGVPAFNAKIAEKKNELKNLKTEGKDLLKMQKALEQEIVDQEIDGKYLYDQIEVWSVFFDKQCDKEKEEQKILVEKSKDRLKDQATQSIESQVRKKVLSKAFDDAQQELQKTFESEKEGRVFLSSVIKRMSKELS